MEIVLALDETPVAAPVGVDSAATEAHDHTLATLHESDAARREKLRDRARRFSDDLRLVAVEKDA
jgi:hypothetical protein